MTRVKKAKPLELPDFYLKGPLYQAARTVRDETNPVSIVRHILDRFPFQPDWPPFHPMLIGHASEIRKRSFLSELLSTDAEFGKLQLEIARQKEQDRRLKARRLIEMMAREAHAEHWVMMEALSRAYRFQEMLKNSRELTQVIERGRQHALQQTDYISNKALEQAIKWQTNVRQLIKEAAEHYRLMWDWRNDVMYVPQPTGGFRKTKIGGHRIEDVAGELSHIEKEAITKAHTKWRKDNYFVPLPSGGIARNEKTGEPLEHLLAKLHQPKLTARRDETKTWRETASLITTPNDGLIHARHQGHMPEHANAEIHAPTLEARTEGHERWHAGRLQGPTPNDGFAQLTEVGEEPEKVAADHAWPRRDEGTQRHQEWHQEGLQGPTPNGGFAPLEDHGKSIVQVAADHALPQKIEATEAHQRSRETQLTGVTSNGGISPLKKIGDSSVTSMANVDAEKKKDIREDFEMRRVEDLYVLSSNEGYRRLKRTGAPHEEVAADHQMFDKEDIIQYFKEKRDAQLFTPTDNMAFRRLETLGDPMEKTVSDVQHLKSMQARITAPSPDTKHSMEVATGKSVGAPPTPPSDPAQPLASSREREEVMTKRHMAELKLFLSAHEQSVSLLRTHAVEKPPRDIDITQDSVKKADPVHVQMSSKKVG